MAELKRVFTSGKMNKDLDERLVPNGQYTDALNVQVSTSDDANVGAIENVLGNTKRYKKTSSVNWSNNFGLTNAKCIGVFRDALNEKIYWFLTSDSVDAVVEYDQTTDLVAPVLVDTGSILNFSSSYLITGVNMIDGLLAFTDNLNEPRIINVSTFKAGSTQSGTTFNTHTQVYGISFLEEHVTVIKKKPENSPSVTAASTSRAGSTIGLGLNTVTTTKNFCENTGGGFFPPREVGSSVAFTVSDTPNWVVGDIINLTASQLNDNNFEDEYQVRLEIDTITGSLSRYITCTIQSISSDLPNYEYTWTCVLEEEKPMFNLQFPRFAYRWKYKNNMYSAFSPWTQAVFVPGDFKYTSMLAHNVGMVNNLRKLTLGNFDTPPKDVDRVEILYKDSSSNNIYKVDDVSRDTSSYSITSELIYHVINENQAIRPYDNVPKKALAQELIGNRLVYGNYVQNYDVNVETDITVDLVSSNITSVKKPEESIKSLRTYQVGISYLDEYGRETPVFTNDTATVVVDKNLSKKVNQLRATFSLGDSALSALSNNFSHFKYYVKETSSEYYNLCLDRYYAAEDGNIWLSFPSAERNKVFENGYLELKKENNTDYAVEAAARYKVLDIKNEVPEYVSRKLTQRAGANIQRGLDSEKLTSGKREFLFVGPEQVDNPEFFKGFKQLTTIRFKRGGNVSSFYEVERAGFTGDTDNHYRVELTEKIKAEDNWIDSVGATTDIQCFVYERDYVAKSEYEGRFFVKINRDVILEESIIYNYTTDVNDYELISNTYIAQIYDTLQDDPDATDTPVSDLEKFGWEEHANAQPSVTINGKPTQNSDEFGFAFAPYDSTDATPLGSAGEGFNDELDVGSVIQFKDASTGDWSGNYQVASITKGTYDRQPSSSGDTDDETGYYWNITLTTPFTQSEWNTEAVRLVQRKRVLPALFDEDTVVLSSSNPAIFETEPRETADLDIYYEACDPQQIANVESPITLPYFNCYSFGNGVESDRINDDFNAKTITKGVTASTTLDEPYAEEHRASGLIYSGIFNSTSGVNELNQFIAGLKITKDLNPIYGSVQKLHARDTDLVTLCEDKCFRVLAQKDALFNADGNANLTSTNNVLGQVIPYVGEFGISKNPESFASYGFRAYFSDKNRGVVLRLSRDGLTPISGHGMSDYFQDNLKLATTIIGSYDEESGAYNISLNDDTVTFDDMIDGWVSRKSFYPEFGVSLNNEYYTFKDGEIWQHNNSSRSNFYGAQYKTSVQFVYNDMPSRIKNFKTLAYEGSEGWTCPLFQTDQQDGEVVTWKDKENIYYNYIRGRVDTWNNSTQSGTLDTSEFSVQGIDVVDIVGTVTPTMQLLFNNEINVSLQEAADDFVFYQKSDGSVYKIGTCSGIGTSGGQYMVSVNNTEGIEYDNGGTSIEDGDFVFFVKNSQINTSGIIGYHGRVDMEVTSSNFKELFAVNSETFISS